MEREERDEKIISSKSTDKDSEPILRETMTEEEKEKQEKWWQETVADVLNSSGINVPSVNKQLQE